MMSFPDWKNEAEYAYITIGAIKAGGVAWEFLRRNQDYQADYEALKKGTVSDAEGNSPQIVKDDKYFGPMTGFFVPPLKPGQSHRAWLLEGPNRRILSPAGYLATKWKVDALCDPQKSALEEVPEFDVPQHPRIITQFDDLDELEAASDPGEDQEVDVPIPLSPNNILVVFSWNERITPQWKRIGQQLTDLQRNYAKSTGLSDTSSPKSAAWIPALHAWDSQVFATDLPKIERAAILYNEDKGDVGKRFDDNLKTAKRLIEGEYLGIVRRGSD